MFVFTREFPTSSDYYVEALSMDRTWSGSAGHAASATYNFFPEGWEYLNTDIQTDTLNSSEQAAIDEIFQDISNVANITFTETTDINNTDIVIRQADLGSEFLLGLTYPYTAFFSTFLYVAADVIVNSSLDVSTPGSLGHSTMIHEIGHAIGLGHPHEDVLLPVAEDVEHLTVMSYNNTGITAGSMMLYDVATLQFLYGANTNYNSGNTSIVPTDYPVISSTEITPGHNITAYTIWDGGGIDTFDISSLNMLFLAQNTIDLREGKDYVTNLNNLEYYWMAFGANIENAIGHASTADSIIGNSLNNALSGLGGNDTLFGSAGNDTLLGSDGDDVLNGNQGDDQVTGGNGNDTVIGGKGNDSVNGNQGNDSLDGSIGADILSGGKGDDTILGGSGGDILRGDIGNDVVSGNADNDNINGDDGNDTMYGGRGDDTVFGGAGDDFIYGDIGNDILSGGSGSDIFVITSSSGSDIIADFENPGVIAGDTLYISSSIYQSASGFLRAIDYSSNTATVNLLGGEVLTFAFAAEGRFLTSDDVIII